MKVPQGLSRAARLPEPLIPLGFHLQALTPHLGASSEPRSSQGLSVSFLGHMEPSQGKCHFSASSRDCVLLPGVQNYT